MGLDFPRAHAINPRLIHCSITAFGPRGPLRDLPGYDPLMQAYGGLMALNGHPGGEPARVATSIVDMSTGMWAVIGILGALRERETTGRGVEVSTALFDSVLAWVGHFAMGYLGSGAVPQPQGSGVAMIAPYQAFPTSDGWAMIAAGSDALFTRLTRALDLPALSDDARFRDNPSRVRHRAALAEAIGARTREWKSAALIETLRQAGVPCAPILTVDAVLSEPQTEASGMLVGAPHPRIDGYRSIALPVTWHARRPGVRRVPPALGEHSEDVLTALGYTRDDVRGLRARGVVNS
jgi:crotonobetainyl-CoA:carnitine CoA-transferase CaiB-like acyl-CoA transferase